MGLLVTFLLVNIGLTYRAMNRKSTINEHMLQSEMFHYKDLKISLSYSSIYIYICSHFFYVIIVLLMSQY